tara:strand:+ start:2773 stop:3135 length:363 start_codon:yes stop_codon:yes gene_type:complete
LDGKWSRISKKFAFIGFHSRFSFSSLIALRCRYGFLKRNLFTNSSVSLFSAPRRQSGGTNSNRFPSMRVLSSLASAKRRHADCQVVSRKGTNYVICKTNPKFKARQGATKGTRLSKKGIK